MNRRGFLGALLGGAAAAASFDPEKALWVPGAKLISIPPPKLDLARGRRGYMEYKRLRDQLCAKFGDFRPGMDRDAFLAWKGFREIEWPQEPPVQPLGYPVRLGFETLPRRYHGRTLLMPSGRKQ